MNVESALCGYIHHPVKKLQLTLKVEDWRQNMSLFLISLLLLYHAVLADSNCTVIGCDSDFCKNNTCTKCIEPYFLNGEVCRHCYLHCRECATDTCYRCIHSECNYACSIADCPPTCSQMQNIHCDSCPDGFYRFGGFCYSCLHTGCKCSSASSCNECFPGRYNTSSKCEYTCPTECITCTSVNNCTKCRMGKYGPACGSDCLSQCEDGSCDKVSGICPSGCTDNQYLDSNQVCRNCSSRCSRCTDNTQCISCKKTYYWGPACGDDCTGCYANCNKDTGCSSICDARYYREYDENKNGYVCIRCPETCLACTSSTNCTKCNSSYWGSNCKYSCSGCSSDCSKTGGCGTSCTIGRYSVNIETGYICKECSEHCDNCLDDTTCIMCQSGYYVAAERICVKCSANCIDLHCNQSSGVCTEGCFDGWSGPLCDTECPSNCLKCNQFNALTCDICGTGFYGTSCEKSCSPHCNQSNEHQICQKNNGNCIHGCKNGYWGETCNKQCGAGCNQSLCDTITGNCVYKCIGTHYGQRCEAACSSRCRKGSATLRQCHEIDGRCEGGCTNGWHGVNCSSMCSNCLDNICFQLNGTCEHGCTDGFTGTYCDEKSGSQDRSLSNGDKNGGDVAVYAGAGAGAIIVIVIVIVAVILLRRKRAADNEAKQGDMLFLEHTGVNGAKDENTYATITDSNTKCRADADVISKSADFSEVSPSPTFVMAPDLDPNSRPKTPIDISKENAITGRRLYTNQEPNKVILSEKQNNAVTSLVAERKEEVKNENILDKDPEKVAEENVDEEGNTYYNTVGKRVLVADLADYVRNRDYNMFLEEFNKLPTGLLKEYNTAKHPKNASKNRYKMIYPYDESRVILKDGPNDYINASIIQGYNEPKEYIGSLGPFQRGTNDNGTVIDFWRMVWQEKCETIVMLTKCFENKEQKCEQYWPELGQSKEYAKLNVSCVTEDQYADFTIRSFVVTKDGQILNSRHLHFTAWPDKGVPADVTSMIEYRQKVRSLHKDAKGPMLVHCSAGIGRTGTFIALDMLTFMGEARGYVDMFGCVANLRFHRTNLVQTPEQYEYLHHAILHALTFDCKSITGEKFIETYSKLIKKKDGKSQLETQFKKLQSTIDEMSVEDKAAVDRNKALIDKNREGADIPGDENRVRLFENRKASASDYVNALFINGFRSRNKFIVAQTPLPATVHDFLSLIFQVKCSCVVMMEETDLQDKTVGVYWPADNQVIKHGVFQVACKESKTTASYTVKTLSVKRKIGKKEEVQDVSLFIYTNWPNEAAVPKSSDSLIQLVKDVDTKNHRQDDEKPILVHCMTGAVRSCLYCAVSVLIEKMEIEHEVSVVNTLRQIKARRRSSIPTLDQYKFCHQAVISYIQTFDIYSNFGLKSK